MNWLLAVLDATLQRDLNWKMPTADRGFATFDGVALALFDWLLPPGRPHEDRRQTLAAVHAGDTAELVAARTLLWSIIAGIAAGCCTVVAVPVGLDWIERFVTGALAGTPISVSGGGFSQVVTAGLAVLSGLLITVAVAIAVHEARWWWFDRRAATRGRRIEATLPRSIALMYALSRGGMPLPRILRTLADTEAVYGAAAAEFGVVVREMDAVGTDVISALEARGQRTPSDRFAELCETLGTVHGSNQGLADYLHAQHERSRAAAATDQEQSLDYLSVLAEGYVTGLVVGPLFVLTTLTLVGLAITDTRPVIRLLVFVVIPLLTAGFLAVIDGLRTARERPGDAQRDRNTPAHRSVTADGESADGHPADRWATQRATLRLYDRLGCGQHWLRQPRATLLANPWLTWLVTLPAGIVWLAVTVQAPTLTLTGLLSSLVGPVSLVAIGGCVGYATVYELAAARRRRIEAAAPELLDRLCSLTDAGLPVVDALQRAANTELGAVTPMIQQAWRDVGWGATVETALRRFATRARSPRLTRAVTLVTTASRASGDIAPVVSIAATELRASRRRDRDRRRLVATYVLVIYIGFLVFVGILVSLSATFLPVITAQTTAAAAVGTDTTLAADPASAVGTAGHSPAQSLASYRSLFFQTAAVQAVCSGVAAGKLANGTVRGGAKHVAALLVVAHVAFYFV